MAETIAIYRCPRHGDFYAIGIEGNQSAERITDSKCCGQWSVVRSWPLNDRMVEAMERAVNRYQSNGTTEAA